MLLRKASWSFLKALCLPLTRPLSAVAFNVFFNRVSKDRLEIACLAGALKWKALPTRGVTLQDPKERKYRVQAVSVAGSFESRQPLPAAWRGLREEALSQKAGIPGCVFVHASGFIGGNATYEGVLEMARHGLQEQ